MKKDEHFSEEQLNALIDGELDPVEKGRLYTESERSAELDQRLCQQRKIKELVKHAYEEVPRPRRFTGAPLAPAGFFGRSLVASALLVMGLAIGFLAERYMVEARSDESLSVAPVAVTEPETDNYILHVASGEPDSMYAALQEARELLDSAEDGQFRQVEIVANEKGLDLLRSDVTPYADEIASLQASNVVFYACSRTIERLEEKGVKVRLLPETKQDYTALDRVVLRMKDHWKYKKI
jgi:intracellular sulfur oxidation DsrE/DsrF family protein